MLRKNIKFISCLWNAACMWNMPCEKRKNTVEAQISFFVAIMPCHYSEIRSKKYGMTQYRTNYLINEIDKFKRNLTRKSSNYKLTLKSLKFSSKTIIYIMQIWKTQLGIQISHGCLFVLLQYLANILLLVLLFFFLFPSFFLPFLHFCKIRSRKENLMKKKINKHQQKN